MTAERWPPLNREHAWERMEAIGDPVARRLVKDALGIATTRYTRPDGVSEADFRAGLPSAPLDLLVLVDVVEQLGRDKERLRRILDGAVDDDGW